MQETLAKTISRHAVTLGQRIILHAAAVPATESCQPYFKNKEITNRGQ